MSRPPSTPTRSNIGINPKTTKIPKQLLSSISPSNNNFQQQQYQQGPFQQNNIAAGIASPSPAGSISTGNLFSPIRNTNNNSNNISSGFIEGSWSSGGSITGKTFEQYQKNSALHQQQLQKLNGAGTTNNNPERRKKGGNKIQSSLSSDPQQQQEQTQRSRINFPIFDSVSYGQQQPEQQQQSNTKNSSAFLTDISTAANASNPQQQQQHQPMRPFTVEAAGNIPLVGEWLAQRRFLLFPRAPPLKDSSWNWALLKSYVLRRDCMEEITAMRVLARVRRDRRMNSSSNDDGAGSSRRRNKANQSPFGSFSAGSVASLKRRNITRSRSPPTSKNNNHNDNNNGVSFSDETKNLLEFRQTAAAATPQPSSSASRQNKISKNLGSSTPTNNHITSSIVDENNNNISWSGTTPSRNLLIGNNNNDNNNNTLAILDNLKNSPAVNSHVSKLRQAVLSVERRKMWYEHFDASRRAERSALSEKRQREAANRHAIKEWTWEEDEMLIKRKLEQEERNALAKRMAKEKLDRIQHASKSLGIGAPIVLADFSYLKMNYFFELLSLRPRNSSHAENLENAKMLKFDKTLAGTSTTSSGNSSKGTPAEQEEAYFEYEEQQEKLRYLLHEDSFTRFVLDSCLVTPLPDEIEKQRRNRPPLVVKTANGIRVEDLSSDETYSDLLKLYRRYLVAENVNIDTWKEEDMGFASKNKTGSGHHNDVDENNGNHQNGKPKQKLQKKSSGDPQQGNANEGEGSPEDGGDGDEKNSNATDSNAHNNNNNNNQNINSTNNPKSKYNLHPGDKNFQHFPLSCDKASQRFYSRFLSLDYGQQRLKALGVPQKASNGTTINNNNNQNNSEKDLRKLNAMVSSAYNFDMEAPPQLPYINALKLKGNNLVDSHIVQFPNGNWRSAPGPISSFHDMTFVLTIRCPLWRLTLVSLDLSENLLTQLPDEIAEIPRLHSLFLQGNHFTSLTSLEKLSDKRGEQIVRMSLYDNPVIDVLGLKDYTNRMKFMFPLMSHLDNVYIPCE